MDGGDAGDAADGITIPLDGGPAVGGVDGGPASTTLPTVAPNVPPGVYKVITARVSGQIDIQQVKTTATEHPGVVYRGVTLPPECGTPFVGDWGTAHPLDDGTIVFVPAAPMPGAPSSPVPLGGATEHETAYTDAYAVSSSYATGFTCYLETGDAYNEAGDKILYHQMRPWYVTPRGQIWQVGAETRVTTDVSEPC
jgi:hypothetical protein